MSRKKDKRKPIELLYEEIIAAHKKGLNDRKFLYPPCKNTNTRRATMASTAKPSWRPHYLSWGEVNQESLFQDVFHQKVLDKPNEQAAAIFADSYAGAIASAHDWQIRMGRGKLDYGDSLGKELLIKLSEGLKGAKTMQLYHTYIVDLKNHAIYPYGPILAENKGLARDQALAYLVSAATVPDFEDVKVFDGEIEHYYIAVVEIVSGIPSKIKEE